MQLITTLLFIASIIFSTSSSADCWFDCDTIARNISTDAAKVYEVITRSGHREKNTNGDTTYFCGENDEHEMHAISVERDLSDELLSINFSQYSPPKYGSSEWDFMEVDLGLTLKIAKTLNFGLMGIKDEKSGDKRCRMALLSTSFLGTAIPGNTFTVVCSYARNASLPISSSLIKRKHNIVSIRNCK